MRWLRLGWIGLKSIFGSKRMFLLFIGLAAVSPLPFWADLILLGWLIERRKKGR